MKNNRILSLFFLLTTINVLGQSPLTTNWNFYHLVDRYEIRNGVIDSTIFTATKPFRRDEISNFSKTINIKSGVDSFNKVLLNSDAFLYSNEDVLPRKRRKYASWFYPTNNALLVVKQEDFNLVVNPVIYFDGSMIQNDSLNGYRNTRGMEVYGDIAKKVGFYSFVSENQTRLPSFMRDEIARTGVVKGTTLHKPLKSIGNDFFNIRGYVTASPIKQIMLQFGHDNNFIGNGYRSLILSDNTSPYLFLKINTKVWKLNYQNLFSEQIDFKAIGESARNPKKYTAFHHLSANITKNLNIGLFENIIFSRADSLSSGGFELGYMNPIIFYRGVEHGLNSSDNAVLGADWKYNFLKHFSFYGQLVIDEFIKDRMFARNKSWTNKWASQFGLKYIDVLGVKNLDVQLEHNIVRPYTYQHGQKSQNYIHYNQSLAHPLGSNLRESIVILRYQPIPKLFVQATFSSSLQGLDEDGLNYGGSYTSTYNNRPPEDYYPIGGGKKSTITALSASMSYMFFQNMYVDAAAFFRSHSLPGQVTQIRIFNLGLRMNTSFFDYRN